MEQGWSRAGLEERVAMLNTAGNKGAFHLHGWKEVWLGAAGVAGDVDNSPLL